jgi:hypothetical protein
MLRVPSVPLGMAQQLRYMSAATSHTCFLVDPRELFDSDPKKWSEAAVQVRILQ